MADNITVIWSDILSFIKINLPSIGFFSSEILPPLLILSITDEICFLKRVVSLALFKLIGVAPWFSFPGFAKDVLRRKVKAASVVSSHPYKQSACRLVIFDGNLISFQILNISIFKVLALTDKTFYLFLTCINDWTKRWLHQWDFLKCHWSR